MSLNEHTDINAIVNRLHDGRATAEELKALLDKCETEPGFAEGLMEDFGPDIIGDVKDEIERIAPTTIIGSIIRTLFGRAA